MGDNYQEQLGTVGWESNITISSPPPFIKPSIINIDSLVSKPNNNYPYTGFKIYRKALCSQGYDFKITTLFWNHEDSSVKQEYINFANIANEHYKKKWPHKTRRRYQQGQQSQIPVNQLSSPVTTSTSILTHSINNSSSFTPAIEQGELYYDMNTVSPYFNPLETCNQTDLLPSNENLNEEQPISRVNITAACNPCKISKVRCEYFGIDSCKRCAKKDLKCIFGVQKKRGPKNDRSNISSHSVIQKLDKHYKEYTQKINKLGYYVDRMYVRPNNSVVSNLNSDLQILTPMEGFTAYTSTNYGNYSSSDLTPDAYNLNG